MIYYEHGLLGVLHVMNMVCYKVVSNDRGLL